MRQSYDEEKVLVFLDNPAGILVPDISYNGESPMIVAGNLDVSQIRPGNREKSDADNEI